MWVSLCFCKRVRARGGVYRIARRIRFMYSIQWNTLSLTNCMCTHTFSTSVAHLGAMCQRGWVFFSHRFDYAHEIPFHQSGGRAHVAASTFTPSKRVRTQTHLARQRQEGRLCNEQQTRFACIVIFSIYHFLSALRQATTHTRT